MKRWFYLIVGLQLLFLIGEAASYEAALHRGQTVLLKVAPVDPRSLFMGNYLALSYDISTLALTQVSHEEAVSALHEGDIVYVVLTPAKPWARPVEVRATEPPRQEGRPFLRGRIDYVARETVRVEYGLERYYISEKDSARANEVAGWRWEPGRRRPQLTAEVAVTGEGRGLIRRVLLDGKPLGF